VGETKALLTDEEHFYTFQLAHPITINCDSSSDDDADDVDNENNNNDGAANNEGAEVDDKHSSCCSLSPPSGSLILNDSLSWQKKRDICCDKGTSTVIDPISTVVMVSSAKKKMMMMKVRGEQQGEKKEEEEEDSDSRDRSQKSRSMDSEMIHDAKSYKDRALWTNELTDRFRVLVGAYTQYGYTDWSSIATKLGHGMTHRQCSTRWREMVRSHNRSLDISRLMTARDMMAMRILNEPSASRVGGRDRRASRPTGHLLWMLC